ncbi:MAG: hypothetical protein M0Q47_00105 [Methanothrix sp.]|nr:hypothetical protein [Methanothrix sp.]MCK9404805.1 hypothetical protein [Methanothrix sp.]
MFIFKAVSPGTINAPPRSLAFGRVSEDRFKRQILSITLAAGAFLL